MFKSIVENFIFNFRDYGAVMKKSLSLALMLTGLSLRTSITEMIPTQYGKIFKVDAQIFYKDF